MISQSLTEKNTAISRLRPGRGAGEKRLNLDIDAYDSPKIAHIYNFNGKLNGRWSLGECVIAISLINPTEVI